MTHHSGGDVPHTAVAMFCGPHDEGNQVPTRRIDQAINLALSTGSPLFIAGDRFNGDEITRFKLRARNQGVTTIVEAFDPRHCTLSDAQATAREILARGYHQLTSIHLVTDWWHMPRAAAMLRGELQSTLGRVLEVIESTVHNGPCPVDLVLSNEKQGLDDYRAGTYGQRFVIDPLPHCSQPSP
jgi:hypothetical protein